MVKKVAINAAIVIGVLVVLHMFAPATLKGYTGTT